ncbi:MAG: enoyl-CoA hydratase/isomerase family protein [Chloroflexi bacterium]|nr:enoyl-CoA hydratase/isomerase family protein [Chloroflexota bacterium]
MPDYEHYQTITVQRSGGVATVTMKRPQVLNAINVQMRQELEDVWKKIADDAEVKAVVLTGSGRAFCAGGDIREMNTGDAFRHADPMRGESIPQRIIEVPQPIVCAINGDAVGLGATIALLCDVTFMADTARIGDPHVKVGLVAGDGGAVIWPLLVGVARAKEYLLTGDLIPAGEAERIGLVNHVVPAAEVLARATNFARRLAEGPTLAIRWTKLSVNKHVREAAERILDTSMAVELLTIRSEDHAEATRAFLDRRPPQFKGR